MSRVQIEFPAQFAVNLAIILSVSDDDIGDFIGTEDQQEKRVSVNFINSVRNGGRQFDFRGHLRITTRFDGELWTIESGDLEILGYGHSEKDAYESFTIQFASTWDSIAEQPDSELTRDAQQLKRRMRRVVSKVS